jgi:hypothetical protein
LERAFVEWFASGLSAAAAVRKAAGRDAGPAPDASRQQGYKLRARPRVKAAIEACLADRTAAARLDREWLLQKLLAYIDDCEQRGSPRATRRLIEALQLVGKLQGWLGNGRRSSSSSTRRPTVASEPSRRLDDLIAKAQAALGPTLKTQANVGDADHHGRTPNPPSAGPAQPQATGIPVSAAAGDQLASAAGRDRAGPRGYMSVYRETFMGIG